MIQTLPRVRQVLPPPRPLLCLLPAFPPGASRGPWKEGVLPALCRLERVSDWPGAQAAGSQGLRDRCQDSAGSPGCTQPSSQALEPSSPARTIRFVTLSNPMSPLTWTVSQRHGGVKAVCARGRPLQGDLQACCTHSHRLTPTPTPTPTASLTLPGVALGSILAGGGGSSGGADGCFSASCLALNAGRGSLVKREYFYGKK